MSYLFSMTGTTRQKSPRYSTQYGPVNKVVLYTNARDEKNIKEWVAHHLLIGFHRIVIFDHKSKIPISYVLKGFDKRVTVLRCVWNNPVKLRLMQTSINLSRGMRADWMLYLDADEFLVLPKHKNVVNLLSKYVNYDSVSINWLMFGTNNIVKDPQGLIIDNFTKSSKTLDQHVKSFVRPMEAINAHNPHFFNIYHVKRRIGMDNRIVKVGSPFHPFPIPFSKAPAYIAHYIHQSEETYTERKVLLPTDDTGAMRGDNRAQVHSLYNDVENLQVKSMYSDKVNTFLMIKSGTYKNIVNRKEKESIEEKSEEIDAIDIDKKDLDELSILLEEMKQDTNKDSKEYDTKMEYLHENSIFERDDEFSELNVNENNE